MLKYLALQEEDQGNLKRGCQSVNNPKIILPGLVMEGFHANQTANRSTESAQCEQNPFRHTPSMVCSLILIIAKQKKSNQTYWDEQTFHIFNQFSLSAGKL
jgi:hypothetical protein